MVRDEAIKIGQPWYFTGKPCLRGHVARRNVLNGTCYACASGRIRQQRAADPEKFRAKERQAWADNRESRCAGLRRARLKRIEERRQHDSDRYHNDTDRKASTKARAVKWGKVNKGKRASIIAARRMAMKRATPPWLTTEQKNEIRAFYLEAARRPGEWHVDHIYPIKGKTSCGLHVPWNLQILTGDENRRKGNKVDGAE